MFQVVFTSNPSDANGIRWSSRLDISYSHYQTFQQLFLFSPAVLSLTLRQTKITLANQHFLRVLAIFNSYVKLQRAFEWEKTLLFLLLWPCNRKLTWKNSHSHGKNIPVGKLTISMATFNRKLSQSPEGTPHEHRGFAPAAASADAALKLEPANVKERLFLMDPWASLGYHG